MELVTKLCNNAKYWNVDKSRDWKLIMKTDDRGY